jgi:hypothetical protein
MVLILLVPALLALAGCAPGVTALLGATGCF